MDSDDKNACSCFESLRLPAWCERALPKPGVIIGHAGMRVTVN